MDVHAAAVVGAVEIVGECIRIAGDVRKANLRATAVIELFDGAKLDVGRIETDKVVVVAGNGIRLTQPLTCRDLEIEGTLEADVKATGTVIIRPGGVLDGTLESPGFTVEEGGGLRASVQIRPDERERR